jgi:Pyridoxal phosphate biosynthesis protein PdxJ
MTRLSVNLNKVALLRNSRNIGIPSVRRAALWSIEAGAHSITVHPRPDQGHIRPADVYELAKLLAKEWRLFGSVGSTDRKQVLVKSTIGIVDKYWSSSFGLRPVAIANRLGFARYATTVAARLKRSRQ